MEEHSEVPQNRETYNTSSEGYQNNGLITIRLDTQPMLDSVEAFLKGTKVIGYKETPMGALTPIYGTAGKAKANDEGIQSIMAWITPLFSPHTVQGNYKDREELNQYLCYIQKGLAKYIMSNREAWGIKRQDYSGVIRMVMNTAEPFYSRLLENKERESYQATMRTVETNHFQDQPKKKFLGIFGG